MSPASVTVDRSGQVPRVTLSDGVQMPLLGFGTSGVASHRDCDLPGVPRRPDPAYQAIRHAIRAGYRFFDTAALYKNEEIVGQAVRDAIAEGSVRRDELFICTKVWNTAHMRSSVVRACRESLEKLGLDYVDLYLIHWPMGYLDRFEPDDAWIRLEEGGVLEQVEDRVVNPRHPSTGKLLYSRTHFTECWRGMEDVKDAGLARSVGVSNFDCAMIDQLFALDGLRHRPTVNQVEMHVYLSQKELLAHARRNQMVVNAYCPLGAPGANFRPRDAPELLDEPKLRELATKYNKTPAQVALMYHLARGVVPIPKSSTLSRIEDNIDVWDVQLTADELAMLESLDRGLRYCESTAGERCHDHFLYPKFSR